MSGYLRIIVKVIGYSSLVRRCLCIHLSFLIVFLLRGFSRGAYQVRVLAGMIEKVRSQQLYGFVSVSEARAGWSTPQGQQEPNSIVRVDCFPPLHSSLLTVNLVRMSSTSRLHKPMRSNGMISKKKRLHRTRM